MPVFEIQARLSRRSLRNRSRRRLVELSDMLHYEEGLLRQGLHARSVKDQPKDRLIDRVMDQLERNARLRDRLEAARG